MSFEADQKKLLKELKENSNLLKKLDPVIKNVALQSNRRLKLTTNASKKPQKGEKKSNKILRGYTGSVRNAWGAPLKISLGYYSNENSSKSDDGKHLIVNILNFGRRAVYPVYAKSLYLPITGRGRKKYRSPIPNDAKLNRDYIWRKSVKGFTGTRFLEKEYDKAQKDIVTQSLKKI